MQTVTGMAAFLFNPTEWDINLARNATNKMLIYCKDPKNTVNAFYNAVGLYNPSIESAPGISPKYLDDFRKQVALELGLQEFKATDPKEAMDSFFNRN